jgi:hypothetical protein
MRKLELKKIVGYLPYNLCIYTEQNKRNYHIAVGFFGDGYIKFRNDRGNTRDVHISSVKIILRPLSDLYKTITHRGKEIIPIVKMAKMHNNRFGWFIPDNHMVAIAGKYKFNLDCFGDFTFYYDGEEKVEEKVNSQVELFDFLHELKIDYRGLIDNGLAIDANTLEQNPYK